LKSAALHALSLARYSVLHAYSTAADHVQPRVRFVSQLVLCPSNWPNKIEALSPAISTKSPQ